MFFEPCIEIAFSFSDIDIVAIRTVNFIQGVPGLRDQNVRAYSRGQKNTFLWYENLPKNQTPLSYRGAKLRKKISFSQIVSPPLDGLS